MSSTINIVVQVAVQAETTYMKYNSSNMVINLARDQLIRIDIKIIAINKIKTLSKVV